MSHRHKRVRIKPGQAPGTLRIDPTAPQPVIDVVAFGPDGCAEESLAAPRQFEELLRRWPVLWVNVTGLGDEIALRTVADSFNLHRLALEDVVHTTQRPKVEPYDDHLFIVVRFPHPDGFNEQISMFLGEHYVLTFQERPGDCFEPVRDRVRAGKGILRNQGPDYLAYALIDAVIDSHFPALEALGQRLLEIEDEILKRPADNVISRIREVKSHLQELQRFSWLHTDVANTLIRSETRYVGSGTKLYLRDCADHGEHIKDLVAAHASTASDLMSVYLSSVSNRMNQVMKVLTIIASIFIPLSFVAGIYGMNFDAGVSRWNMPELQWRYGYPAVLMVMGIVAGGLLYFFKRRNWL